MDHFLDNSDNTACLAQDKVERRVDLAGSAQAMGDVQDAENALDNTHGVPKEPADLAESSYLVIRNNTFKLH